MSKSMSVGRVGLMLMVLVVASVTASFCGDVSNVAAFLELGAGARPLALGWAFVAIADDANLLQSNPAGLSLVKRPSVLAAYETRLGTCKFGHVAGAWRGFGCAVSYLDFGLIPKTDRSGAQIGSFTHQDFALIGAVRLAEGEIPEFGWWSIGALGKLVSMGEQFSGSAGRGGSIDLGLLFRGSENLELPTLLSGFSVGAVIENLLGSDVVWGSDGHREAWPPNVVVGVAVKAGDRVLLAVESDIRRGVSVGLELSPLRNFALRGGVSFAGSPTWSFGVGLDLEMVAVDYAMVIHRFLREQHRVSLTAHF